MSAGPFKLTGTEIKFGTDGWRAIIGDGFTFENVANVTHAVGMYLIEELGGGKVPSKPVVIGHDTRFLANRFAEHAAHILEAAGFQVLIVHQFTPTPIVAHAAKSYDSCGAMMFTASHNPPEYCGIKFIPHYAGPATSAITDSILNHVDKVLHHGERLPKNSGGSVNTFNPEAKYVADIAPLLDLNLLKSNPLKILHDPMFGASQEVLPRLFQQFCGYAPDQIHVARDPMFGGCIPEPHDDYLSELKAKVVSGGYAMGIANDGDSDRIGVIDNEGKFIPNNILMPLLLRYLYHEKGYRGNVARTVATSKLMDALAKKYGFIVHETPVGFKHIGEWMRKDDIIVGGEESGGLSVLKHIPEKDGLFAALLVTEMLVKTGKTLTQLMADLYEDAGYTPQLVYKNFHLDEGAKKELVAWLGSLKPGDQFGGRTILEVKRIDGAQLVFDDYEWILARPSGTEPVLRMYGESPDANHIQALGKALEDKIKSFSLATA